MKFESTRSHEEVSGSYAILHGLAADGGLYLPKTLPQINMLAYLNKNYQTIAADVLGLFFTEFTKAELAYEVQQAYSHINFSHSKITGIREVSENTAYLELFYGRTLAFKDQALSLYPHLLLLAKKYQHETRELLILTATSGDTGKAAMEAVKDIQGIKIAVFYPTDGVSTMQKEQMQKQSGVNVFPVGIRGNFDDAQKAVKRIFTSLEMQALAEKSHTLLTSANSINVARLLPQIVYYVDAYARAVNNGLIKMNDVMDITVPTGNFGNILAAFMAKQCGVPIGMVICATNENNVLHDFIQTGLYDTRKREFYITHSPSMDILVSSNLERFLYLLLKDKTKIRVYMEQLKDDGYFSLDEKEHATMQKVITSYDCTNSQTVEMIGKVYEKEQYLIDPHTAVAAFAAEAYSRNNPNRANFQLIVSTAHPFKFLNCYRTLFAIDSENTYEIARELSKKTDIEMPMNLKELEHANTRFPNIIEVTGIDAFISQCLKKKV
ncbi:L-threonine synthase [Erysipelotrichaceae bacterium]|nr:L-threonine synthase [Erysipelotrichaceae bacterium]